MIRLRLILLCLLLVVTLVGCSSSPFETVEQPTQTGSEEENLYGITKPCTLELHGASNSSGPEDVVGGDVVGSENFFVWIKQGMLGSNHWLVSPAILVELPEGFTGSMWCHRYEGSILIATAPTKITDPQDCSEDWNCSWMNPR